MSFPRDLLSSEPMATAMALPRPIPRRLREEAGRGMMDVLGEGRPPQMPILGLGSLLMRTVSDLRSTREMAVAVQDNRLAAEHALARMTVMALDLMEGIWPGDPRLRTLALRCQTDWSVGDLTPATVGGIEALPRSARVGLREAAELRIEAIRDELRSQMEVLDLLDRLYPGGDEGGMEEMRRTFMSELPRFSRLMSMHRDLREMVDRVGRLGHEEALHRRKMELAHEEMHSIRSSSDIQRMLPIEASYLTDERLRPLFMARLIESRLMTYSLIGEGMVGGPGSLRRGPAIVLVDTSGSMEGEPEMLAKAVVLMMARRMLREGRSLKVVLFSTDTIELDLTGRRSMARDFLAFLQMGFGGGTSFDRALEAGVGSLEDGEWDGADLVFVTDGLSRMRDRGLLHRWDMLKRERDVKVFSVIIGSEDPGGLGPISDSVHPVLRSGFVSGPPVL